MQLRALIFIVLCSLYISCNSPVDSTMLIGTWIQVGFIDNTGVDIRDEIVFDEYGNYNGYTYFYGDSLYSEFHSKYKVNEKTNELYLTFVEFKKGNNVESFPDTTFTIDIVKLTNEKLILSGPVGSPISYERKP